MTHRIEIRPREGFGNPHAEGVRHEIGELGIQTVTSVRSARLFFLYGELAEADARRVAEELLADPVVEAFDLGAAEAPGATHVEVHLKAGVMDPVAASARQAVVDMGLAIRSVRTARRYELTGELTAAQRDTIANGLLANPTIEEVYFEAYTPPESHGRAYELKIVDVALRNLDDAGLEKLSKDCEMFLNVTEMKALQDYFRRIGREPRDVELEMLAQTWSEHCIHKTFRSDVSYEGKPIPGWPEEGADPPAPAAGSREGHVRLEIPNLLKTTIFNSTKEMNKPWCISVFEDNAGVIEFDEQRAVCFKVETHNHPSAIEPYGGAATGIGGVIRDPMGTGMGAEPVANTDIFCFGPVDLPLAELPKGVMHPRRIMRGVVSGVRDYGNRMGIPTVNGAVYFDRKYLGNCLVYCGTVGMLPRDKCFKHPRAGDAIICVGGRTGRDGIHGATFSSGELTHVHETEFSHAVQIGNAITEKKMLDTVVQARNLGLYTAITDCGAGGLSSAVGEMGEDLGAEVHLDRVPLKYEGLTYSEIWISEAQERMVLAVPAQNVERILKLFADEDVEATVIGHYGTEGKVLRLFYDGQVIGEVEMEFLHHGYPRPTKRAEWLEPDRASPAVARQDRYDELLLAILSAPNVASKEWIVRQYDHEVQGGSVIKPLVGAAEDSPGDAAVVRPVLDSKRALVISCGMNPRLGELDPYQSALHAVDEALRNLVAVGGDLDHTALLDNFCWGNCNKPDRMGALVQSAVACRAAALTYGTPFISGKDSLNNEFRTDTGEIIAIPPTLLISAISVIDDAARCVSADAKEAGNHVFLVGRTRGEMGGSHCLLVQGLESGTDVPPVDLPTSRRVMGAVQQAIQAGCVRACHDLSEGGLAVAAAEMAFAGDLGLELDLAAVPTEGDVSEPAKLFAESAGRFLVEVPPEKYDDFARIVKDCPFGDLGRVTDTGRLVISSDGRHVIDLPVADAKAAWQKTFDW